MGDHVKRKTWCMFVCVETGICVGGSAPGWADGSGGHVAIAPVEGGVIPARGAQTAGEPARRQVALWGCRGPCHSPGSGLDPRALLDKALGPKSQPAMSLRPMNG